METFSMLLAICAGNSPGTGEFPAQRPVTQSFDVFFDLRLNKRLSKQSWGWWFETPSRPLWRHRNDLWGPMSCTSGQFHRGPVNSPHKDQWRRALMFSLICVWINGWVNNREAGDLRRHHAHYDVIVMIYEDLCHAPQVNFTEKLKISMTDSVRETNITLTCSPIWVNVELGE